jgi:hypothetical protein
MDPHLALTMCLVTGAAWLMTKAGLAKNLLEPKHRRAICPSCGSDSCRC